MSRNDDMGNIQLIVDSGDGSQNYGVMLPCEPSSFGRFISQLLGKPQLIEKAIYGSFKVDQQDLISTHYLISQRINQQNEATFIQFTAKMFFSDDSSVEINTFDEFVSYSEVKKVNCTLINLSWTYLIKFKNRNIAEKQQIEITFGGAGHSYYPTRLRNRNSFTTAGNCIYISINHTERTWGVDIESLLTSHLQNFIVDVKKIPELVHKNSEKIGFLTGAVFFGFSTAGAMFTILKLAKNYSDEISKITGQVGADDLTSKKIDFLLNITSTGVWPRFILGLVFFMIIALIVSVVLAAWVSVRAESKHQSWILITEHSKEQYVSYLSSLKSKAKVFYGGIIISIICGVVGNIIFSLYFSKLM
ncbi:hypothetical protein RJO42_002273 [Enterobacter hormaechei]|nr:hypothetical protein [Enterobacter hormaechei]MCM7786482.1 hypothetical protein [Enterobacter hormaechei]